MSAVGDARKRLSEQPPAPLAGYFVADDAYGSPCVWQGHPDDPAPRLALHRRDIRGYGHGDLWAAILALVGTTP